MQPRLALQLHALHRALCSRRDYRPIAHLDAYESDGLDEEPGELDMEAEFAARAAADRDLDERDRRGGVLPRALEGEAARKS